MMIMVIMSWPFGPPLFHPLPSPVVDLKTFLRLSDDLSRCRRTKSVGCCLMSRNPNERSPRSQSRQWFPGELPHWPTYDATAQRYIKFGLFILSQ